jgi:hypothetical protein
MMIDTYLISINNFARTDSLTRSFYDVLLAENKLHIFGVNAYQQEHLEFLRYKNLDFIKFIVGGEISDSEFGCMLSHQLVYKDMIDRNHDSAFVFEDDAQILTDLEYLSTLPSTWSAEGWDLVLLFWDQGGVVDFSKAAQVGKIVIPPTRTVSYWLTSDAARLLLSSSGLYTGLADWPLEFCKLRAGVFYKNLVSHKPSQSIIGGDRLEIASRRVPFYLRSLLRNLDFEEIRNLRIVLRILGAKMAFRVFIFNRILMKSLNFLTKRKMNETVVIKNGRFSLK